RIWLIALDRATILGVVNVGLAPFLYWWNKLPSEPFYQAMVQLMMFTGAMFLFSLNPVLRRLTAMLPDEALRAETRFFTTINRYLVLVTTLLAVAHFMLGQVQTWPEGAARLLRLVEQRGLWLALFSLLLPLAMTMALIWKIKEVILSSVFEASR
ncbi:MAG TPA: hypothetical protein VNO52_14860, partial [Methylomirabilota bacterium]|nr:hypothetical protein [Methylomirabilota bacterium]